VPQLPTDANVPDGNRKPSRASTRARREEEVVGQPLFIVDPVSCPSCPGLGRIVMPVARRERSHTYSTKEPEDGELNPRARSTPSPVRPSSPTASPDSSRCWRVKGRPSRHLVPPPPACTSEGSREDAAVPSRRSSPLGRHPGAAESPSHHSRHRGSHVRPKEPTVGAHSAHGHRLRRARGRCVCPLLCASPRSILCVFRGKCCFPSVDAVRAVR
jgi:hypothetical protein